MSNYLTIGLLAFLAWDAPRWDFQISADNEVLGMGAIRLGDSQPDTAIAVDLPLTPKTVAFIANGR